MRRLLGHEPGGVREQGAQQRGSRQPEAGVPRLQVHRHHLWGHWPANIILRDLAPSVGSAVAAAVGLAIVAAIGLALAAALASAVAATAVVGAITAAVIGAVAATIGGAVATAITLTIAAGRRRRVPLHLSGGARPPWQAARRDAAL